MPVTFTAILFRVPGKGGWTFLPGTNERAKFPAEGVFRAGSIAYGGVELVMAFAHFFGGIAKRLHHWQNQVRMRVEFGNQSNSMSLTAVDSCPRCLAHIARCFFAGHVGKVVSIANDDLI